MECPVDNKNNVINYRPPKFPWQAAGFVFLVFVQLATWAFTAGRMQDAIDKNVEIMKEIQAETNYRLTRLESTMDRYIRFGGVEHGKRDN